MRCSSVSLTVMRLDYDICRAILERGDFAWRDSSGQRSRRLDLCTGCGRGFPSECITRLPCPIGIDRIARKLLAAIAMAVAAQVLQAAEGLHATRAQSDTMSQTRS